VAFEIFMVVKQTNRLTKPVAAPAVPTTKDGKFCATAVALAATRCPHGTSRLSVSGTPIPARPTRRDDHIDKSHPRAPLRPQC
jgi:hypothetical protein